MRLFLCALLLCGACAPLRRTRTDLDLHAARRDTALVRLLRREFDRSFGSLEQTVAEFYPPTPAADPADRPAPPETIPKADTTAAPQATAPQTTPQKTLQAARGPLRRLVRTSLRLRHDRATTRDSLVRTATDTTSRTERRDRTEERPSDTTLRLRGLALLAAACAALICFIRRRS